MADVCPLDHGTHAAPDLPPDRYVCHHCTGRLRALLTDLPDTMAALDGALARQLRFTRQHGSRSTTTPLPYAPAAADAMYVARATTLKLADWVAGVRGHPTPQTWASIARYLIDALGWITAHPDGPGVVDELTAALTNARRTIDRPADRAFLGTCGALIEHDTAPIDCPEQLYAPTTATTFDCPRCGTTWQVRDRQDAMFEQIRDLLLPAADLARAITGLSRQVTFDQIRQWKRRGHLTPALDENGNPRANPQGRPLYRVGDVLDLATQRGVSVAEATITP